MSARDRWILASHRWLLPNESGMLLCESDHAFVGCVIAVHNVLRKHHVIISTNKNLQLPCDECYFILVFSLDSSEIDTACLSRKGLGL